MRKLAFCLMLAFLQTAAEEEPPKLLWEGGMPSLIANKRKFLIEYSDQVSGGCLPQPSRLKDQLEISLRQNDFEIVKEDGFLPSKIVITAVGFDTGGGYCAVYLTADLIFWNVVNVPFSKDEPTGNETFAPITYEIAAGIMTGSKTSMQGRLEKWSREAGDNLFLKISRARDHLKEKFPSVLQKR